MSLVHGSTREQESKLGIAMLRLPTPRYGMPAPHKGLQE